MGGERALISLKPPCEVAELAAFQERWIINKDFAQGVHRSGIQDEREHAVDQHWHFTELIRHRKLRFNILRRPRGVPGAGRIQRIEVQEHPEGHDVFCE